MILNQYVIYSASVQLLSTFCIREFRSTKEALFQHAQIEQNSTALVINTMQ